VPARFILIDPTLRDAAGPAFAWAANVLAEAARAGCEPVLAASAELAEGAAAPWSFRPVAASGPAPAPRPGRRGRIGLLAGWRVRLGYSWLGGLATTVRHAPDIDSAYFRRHHQGRFGRVFFLGGFVLVRELSRALGPGLSCMGRLLRRPAEWAAGLARAAALLPPALAGALGGGRRPERAARAHGEALAAALHDVRPGDMVFAAAARDVDAAALAGLLERGAPAASASWRLLVCNSLQAGAAVPRPDGERPLTCPGEGFARLASAARGRDVRLYADRDRLTEAGAGARGFPMVLLPVPAGASGRRGGVRVGSAAELVRELVP